LKNIPREHLETELFNLSDSYDIEQAIHNLQTSLNYVGDLRSIQKELIPFLTTEFKLNIDYWAFRAFKLKFKPSQNQIEYLNHILTDEIKFYKKTQAYFGFKFEKN